jgi:serine phosphatase RsbU (regulator of sigma subunit)
MNAGEGDYHNSGVGSESIENTDLRTLVSHNSSISGNQSVGHAFDEFQRHRCEFMAVLDEDHFVLGILSYEDVGILFGSRYGRDLFAREKVHDHLSRQHTMISIGEPISTALQKALTRVENFFFDDVVLADPSGRFFGLIPMRTMVLLQNRYLLETIEKIDRQRQEISKRQQEMEKELYLAGQLQQAMFTRKSSLFPSNATEDSRPYRLLFRYLPAKLIGGDYFHTFDLTDGVMSVLLCDVMGHGVRSALVTAMVVAVAESHIDIAGDPGAFLTRLNWELAMLLQNADETIFITAQYLLLNINESSVLYSVAGHHDPLHYKRETCTLVPLGSRKTLDGPPLGCFENSVYGTNIANFRDGDLFFLYSDGLFEGFSPEGKVYGHERLLDSFNIRCSLPMETILDEVIEDLTRFCGCTEFDDDVCLIGLEV